MARIAALTFLAAAMAYLLVGCDSSNQSQRERLTEDIGNLTNLLKGVEDAIKAEQLQIGTQQPTPQQAKTLSDQGKQAQQLRAQIAGDENELVLLDTPASSAP